MSQWMATAASRLAMTLGTLLVFLRVRRRRARIRLSVFWERDLLEILCEIAQGASHLRTIERPAMSGQEQIGLKRRQFANRLAC